MTILQLVLPRIGYLYMYYCLQVQPAHSELVLSLCQDLIKQSSPAMLPWADSPFPLIATSKTTKPKVHVDAIWMADQMANVHNCFLRALNAMYQQAPYVQSPEDIRDFCWYGIFWGEVMQYVASLCYLLINVQGESQ